jgi:hypothetical protein
LRLALALLVIATPLVAQDGDVQLEIALPTATTLRIERGGPTIAATNILGDSRMRELLRSGFPAQLHFRLELWRKARWFDDLSSWTEWDVLVSYDPASQSYRVARKHGNQTEDFGGFGSLTSAEAQIDRAYRVSLPPPNPGRFYYTLALDIQTLQLGDLDALERWLRGDARRGNAATAVRRGVGTLLSRVLGGDRRHYEERSGVFSVP